MLTKWGGSSNVKARYEMMPIDAIRNRVGSRATVEYRKGYTSDWPPQPAVQDSLREEALAAARQADLIIFIGGHNKYPNHDTESYDRTGSGAPFRQDEVLEELVRLRRPIVLVTMGANQFDMPWSDRIPAMLHAWYGGSEGGTALADVLFGRVNPSGKAPGHVLPATDRLRRDCRRRISRRWAERALQRGHLRWLPLRGKGAHRTGVPFRPWTVLHHVRLWPPATVANGHGAHRHLAGDRAGEQHGKESGQRNRATVPLGRAIDVATPHERTERICETEPRTRRDPGGHVQHNCRGTELFTTSEQDVGRQSPESS